MSRYFFALCGVILLAFTCILYRLDGAMTQPPAVLNPPIVLISYADGDPVFFRNQYVLAESAADKGFSQIINATRGDIDPAFYHRHRAILEQPRGAGYWLWKPYLILKTMREMPEDAVILYLDSAKILTRPLSPLLELLDHHDIIVNGYGTPMPLYKGLKREARHIFGRPLSSKHLQQEMVMGGFILQKNTQKNRAFMAEWLAACTHAEALTDLPFGEQDVGFLWHQHDQALLSVLIARASEQRPRTFRSLVLRKNDLPKHYGIVHFHRHAKDQTQSPLWVRAGVPSWISTLLWNNPLMRWLRKGWYRH